MENAYTGGFAAFHACHQIPLIPPLLYQKNHLSKEVLRWFQREQPDALIIHAGSLGGIIAEALSLQVPGSVPIAAITQPLPSWAGMDEHPESIGSTAIDLLSSMILHRERNLPQRPSTMMIDGLWHEGLSVPLHK